MARSVSPAPPQSSSSSARPTSRPPSTAPDPTARPRSGSSFTLELPRSGSGSGSRASSVSDARGTRRAGSTADEGTSTDGHKAEEGREEGAKRLNGGIKEILRSQNAAGVGKTYLCVLEGNGKQVQVRLLPLSRFVPCYTATVELPRVSPAAVDTRRRHPTIINLQTAHSALGPTSSSLPLPSSPLLRPPIPPPTRLPLVLPRPLLQPATTLRSS